MLSGKDLDSASNLILKDAVANSEEDTEMKYADGSTSAVVKCKLKSITEPLLKLLCQPLTTMMEDFNIDLVLEVQVYWQSAKGNPTGEAHLHPVNATVAVFSVGAPGVLSICKKQGDCDPASIKEAQWRDYEIPIGSLYIFKGNEYLHKARIQEGCEEDATRGVCVVFFQCNICWPRYERYEALVDKLASWLPNTMTPEILGLIEGYVVVVVRSAVDQNAGKPRTVVVYPRYLKEIDDHDMLQDQVMQALMILLQDSVPGMLGFLDPLAEVATMPNFHTNLERGDKVFQLLHVPPAHWAICFAKERHLYFVCSSNRAAKAAVKRRMARMFCDPSSPSTNLVVERVFVEEQTEVECGCRAFIGGILLFLRYNFDVTAFCKALYPNVHKQYEFVKRCLLEPRQAPRLFKQLIDILDILPRGDSSNPRRSKANTFTINYALQKVCEDI